MLTFPDVAGRCGLIGDVAVTDERQRGTTGVTRRSNLGSETAMPPQMLGDSHSPRQRVLKSSRLALGAPLSGLH